ncbi:DUF2087 domain-containing protein [Brachybacterium sp. JHP9]|uniref:DUF2087 domain-containing protein n=1 Tax=Brachybacterium equifaecis TaxID=2910770 RepID=A0ABT0QWG6_9MICO|nr:DUF2087 domain-containing protein [Brachybacterium equifaecis]MCL6421940.1 DUF2087 domain-containing protein [Brachybacterium equifaecis]
MTLHADLKAIVRARMRSTGENYTAALAAIRAERATDPRRVGPAAPREAPDPARAEPARAPIDPEAARTEHERLLRPFLRDGRILSIPSRRRARFALMLELLARFPLGRTLPESEVNEILRPLHEDVAFLRRELVDYGLLEREAPGTYWVARRLPLREGPMVQEVTDWERVWLPGFLASAPPREEPREG